MPTDHTPTRDEIFHAVKDSIPGTTEVITHRASSKLGDYPLRIAVVEKILTGLHQARKVRVVESRHDGVRFRLVWFPTRKAVE